MSTTDAMVKIRDITGDVAGELRADIWDALREALQSIVLVEEAENSLISTDLAEDVLELLDL